MQSLDVLSDGLFLWVCLMVLASDWEQWQSPRESLLGLLWALVFGYRLGPHILYGPRVHIHVCHPGCSSWGSRSMSHPTLSPQKVEVKGRVAIDRTLLSLTCSAMVVTGAHKCTDGAVGGRVEG